MCVLTRAYACCVTLARLISMTDSRDPRRGDRIRALRKEHHLTQQALAHAVGASVRAVQEWEYGGEISFPNVVQLARVTRVSPEYILGLNGDEPAGAREGQLEERVKALEAITAGNRALLTSHDASVAQAFVELSGRISELQQGQADLQAACEDLGEQISLALLELRRDVAARARRAEDEPAPGTRHASQSQDR